ncbi:MAG TPA: hypothetical protein VF823_00750, partial [Anaerolineales bacterium]
MDLGSIFLFIALLALVGLFVSRPLLEKKEDVAGSAHAFGPAGQEDQKHSSLLAERDRVLNALSELDFDYAVGKIPDEDYPPQRRSLLEHGAQVLRELDVAGRASGDGEQLATAVDSAEARLEAAIAARRMLTAAGAGRPDGRKGGPAADDDIEIQIAARRRLRQEKASGFCPQCG